MVPCYIGLLDNYAYTLLQKIVVRFISHLTILMIDHDNNPRHTNTNQC